MKDNVNIEENLEKKKNNNSKKDNKEVIKLKEENALLNEKILRLNADMQNIKRRSDEEISKLYRYDGEELIKKILPTLDNFERAIGMCDNKNSEMEKFISGFNLIYTNLKNILNEYGVTEIDCLDKEFNPNEMEAVLTENDESKEHNVVTFVMQKGYKYNDKVIRPAMVKVNE